MGAVWNPFQSVVALFSHSVPECDSAPPSVKNAVGQIGSALDLDLGQRSAKNYEHIDQASEPIYSEAVFVSERQKVLGLRRCDNDSANGVFG